MDLSSIVLLLVGVALAATALGAHLSRRARPVTPIEPAAATNVAAIDPTLVHDTVRLAVDDALRHVHQALTAERTRNDEHLDHKKELIDHSLESMRTQLGALTDAIGSIERDRQRSHGELTEQLRQQSAGVAALTATTGQLREALANVKARGQWGERMADDVLRLAGLVEGINYRKQKAITNNEGGSGIPDYTFFMPNRRLLHMDVKFPIDNYLKFLGTERQLEQRAHRDQFLKDVRARVRELVGRGYLDGDDTVDCLLLLIPNEAVYAFVHEHDPAIIEMALRDRIVICSPLTLYAVLAVVRQAVENFALEQRATEILGLLGQFEQQWSKYAEQLDKVQRAFNSVHKGYDELMTTRTRALQRPLDKIAALRGGTSLALVDDVATGTDPRPLPLGPIVDLAREA